MWSCGVFSLFFGAVILEPVRLAAIDRNWLACYSWWMDIKPSEARRIMKGAKYRLKEMGDKYGQWTCPQIFFRGRWRDICRTDLCGEVEEAACEDWPLKKWVGYYRRQILFGVRV